MKHNKEIAFEFAKEKHKNQTRKITNEPYIKHLYDVAKILEENGCSPEVVISGILHDTIEDTNTTYEEIEDKFGKKIATIVLGETENKALEYKERKQERITALKTASFEVKLVKCADMLANITDIEASLNLFGDEIWNFFNAPKQTIAWYYTSMFSSMNELAHLNMHKALKNKISTIFGPGKFC